MTENGHRHRLSFMFLSEETEMKFVGDIHPVV